ncbi:MAG: tetratricopeptide repeat protein [Terracidiphilus sp.]
MIVRNNPFEPILIHLMATRQLRPKLLYYPTHMRSLPAALLFVCLIHAAGQAPSPTTADDFMRDGLNAQRQGNLHVAIEDYRKALAIRPESIETRANLAAALAADGQFDAAIEQNLRLLTALPGQTDIRMNLALAYYKKGDWRNAAEQFKKVHAAQSRNLTASMLLGYSEIKLNQAAAAADLLAPLEPGNENNQDFEFVLAEALIASGREAEGLPRMESNAKATNALDAWVIAGTARLHRQDFRQARADLDAALAINPSLPGLNSLAGQARDAVGDTEDAKAVFEVALRQDPRDFAANLYLGTMRMKQRDTDGARPLLELALQLHPEVPQAQYEMAVLNGMTGNYAAAAAALEPLEKKDPDWLDPHIQLASLYYKLHRPEDGEREREIVKRLEAKEQKNGPPPQ